MVDVASSLLGVHDPSVGSAGASRKDPVPTEQRKQQIVQALQKYVEKQNEDTDLNNWLRA